MNRILLMLAASGLTRRDISRDLKEIFGLDERAIIGIVTELRSVFLEGSSSHQIISSDDFEPNMVLERADRKLGEQISQMLRDDVGLTTDEAGQYLLVALRKYLPPNQRLPLPSSKKESFARWIQRLSVFVPPSVLLHEAAKLRNKLAHTAKSDWPLTDR